uniref:Calmodulin-lysine N-methyltransferase n=1 Tax=Cacopsylla melanoneura TaxID=428564 RepID=A0A8D8MHM7_9HEMI
MASVTTPRDNKGKARKLWSLLAKTLHKEKSEQDLSVVSVRRVDHFGLVDMKPLIEQDNGSWLLYSIQFKHSDQEESFQVKVCHVEINLTANHLIGFNNTGNICVWPSEEVLSYYCLHNSYLFNNKTILELGGGMTCLAGILIAKYLSPQYVLVTDGNVISMDNVARIIETNAIKADCAVLKWSSCVNHYSEYFDVILAADCLFFDEARNDFVSTIVHCLNSSGIALITAPRRGNTLDQFVQCAKSAGLYTLVLQCYNSGVWAQHCRLKIENPRYEEGIHYPLLIVVSKTSSSLLPFQN